MILGLFIYSYYSHFFIYFFYCCCCCCRVVGSHDTVLEFCRRHLTPHPQYLFGKRKGRDMKRLWINIIQMKWCFALQLFLNYFRFDGHVRNHWRSPFLLVGLRFYKWCWNFSFFHRRVWKDQQTLQV